MRSSNFISLLLGFVTSFVIGGILVSMAGPVGAVFGEGAAAALETVFAAVVVLGPLLVCVLGIAALVRMMGASPLQMLGLTRDKYGGAYLERQRERYASGEISLDEFEDATERAAETELEDDII